MERKLGDLCSGKRSMEYQMKKAFFSDFFFQFQIQRIFPSIQRNIQFNKLAKIKHQLREDLKVKHN